MNSTLALALLPLIAPVQGGERLHQPREYASSSGSYSLKVVPSDPSGKGSMRLRLAHGSEEKWSTDFPWTFDEAGVAEDGSVLGYANREKLQFVVLDPQGKVRKQHDVEHTAWVMHGSALPCALGNVLVHSAADLALIRVTEADQERPLPWWAFRISTGEKLENVVPAYPIPLAEDQGLYERDARAVGDTGLTLCHWLFADYRRTKLAWPESGGVFALLDTRGQAVWTLALLDDYTDPASEEATDRLEAEVSRSDVILAVGPGDRFALRHVRPRQRIEYAVERDPAADKGWRVAEVKRSPYEAAGRRQARPEKLTLARKATASLGTASSRTTSPIHEVRHLGFADDGRVEFIRGQGSADVAFVRLKEGGALDFETDLSRHMGPGDSMTLVHDLIGDRWLIQRMHQDPPWLEVDVKTGEAKTAPLPDGMLDCAIAPTADGGYLAAVPLIERSTFIHEMLLIQADGSVAWKQRQWGVGEDDTPFERAVYSADGLVRVSERKFVLLAMDSLFTIDADKNVLGTTSVAEAIGHDPVYVSNLLSDGRGGVYFAEGDKFWHVDAGGKLAGSFAPTRADGSKDSAFDHLLQVAPDGRLWTSDRARIYRLDSNGVADLVLGASQAEDELANPEESRFDSLGRVLIRDRITQAVHVFDSEGVRLHICRIDPAERVDDSLWNSFRGGRDGTTWVTVKGGLAQFDSQGNRIREHTAEELAAKLERGRLGRWSKIEADDPRMSAMSSIRVRPDGKWLAGIGGRGVLPDGRLLILESPEVVAEPDMLHTYTAKGEPVSSIELPEGKWRGLSVSPRWIVVGDYASRMVLLRVEDWKVFEVATDIEKPGEWLAGQTPDGRTLLLLNAERLELARFELP